jgi:signal peptidase I
VKLDLSAERITAELLGDSLKRSGTAVIAVNGNSMHPTLQMGWRVFLKPARGEDLKVGEIAVFRGDHYLTVHRLVWRERGPGGTKLVFRGDYNRLRERIDPGAVIARVAAIEIPGRRKGFERVVALEPDVLALFYKVTYGLYSLIRPILPARPAAGASADEGAAPPGPLGRAARSLFAGFERLISAFLPQKR